MPGRHCVNEAGIGRGNGGRGGRGRRNMLYATGQPGWMRFGGSAIPTQTPIQTIEPSQEKQMLKNQVEVLQSELDLIKNRLSEMETKTTE
jgi:hypothetical protein